MIIKKEAEILEFNECLQREIKKIFSGGADFGAIMRYALLVAHAVDRAQGDELSVKEEWSVLSGTG